MKFTKRIAILLVLLMIVGLFAACGGGKQEDETTPAVTLPGIDAPTGNGLPDPERPKDASGALPTPTGPSGEEAGSKDGEPVPSGNGSAEGKTGLDQTVPTLPNASQPAASEPAPTQAAPSSPATPESAENLTELAPPDSGEDLH